MLGKLGSALSWTYAEVFDPSAKLIKRAPTAGHAVCDIHVSTLDHGRLMVVVLTDAAVDCWAVSDREDSQSSDLDV